MKKKLFFLCFMFISSVILGQSYSSSMDKSIYLSIIPSYTVGEKFWLVGNDYEKPTATSFAYSFGIRLMQKDLFFLELEADINSVKYPDGEELTSRKVFNPNPVWYDEIYTQSDRKSKYNSYLLVAGVTFGEIPLGLYFSGGLGKYQKSYYSGYSDEEFSSGSDESELFPFEPPEYYKGNGKWKKNKLMTILGGGIVWFAPFNITIKADFKYFSGEEEFYVSPYETIIFGDEYDTVKYGYRIGLIFAYHFNI